MSKIFKILLIIAAVVFVGYFAYHFLSSDSSDVPSNQTDMSNLSSAENNTAFLSTLLSLNKIKIDGSLFKTPAFSKLQDNTVPISNEGGVIGRPNPFASIDGQTATDASLLFPQINTGTNNAASASLPVR